MTHESRQLLRERKLEEVERRSFTIVCFQGGSVTHHRMKQQI